jgi:hypothetical protein
VSALELLWQHPQLALGKFDPHLVGMCAEVVVPGRVVRRSAGRCDDQPGVLAVGDQASGVSRRSPVFLPIVVRNRTSIP